MNFHEASYEIEVHRAGKIVFFFNSNSRNLTFLYFKTIPERKIEHLLEIGFYPERRHGEHHTKTVGQYDQHYKMRKYRSDEEIDGCLSYPTVFTEEKKRFGFAESKNGQIIVDDDESLKTQKKLCFNFPWT